jgi:hypothetical protein
MEKNIVENALDSLNKAAPQLADRWEINPKYDVPHLGPYVYVDNHGNMKLPQMGPGYYMEDKENNDE